MISKGKTSAVRRPLLVWVGLALLWGVSPSAGQNVSDGVASEIHFTKLNRTYGAIVTELPPIEVGGATVELRSPRHSVTLERNRVRMRRLEDGSLFANVDLVVSAQGTILADVALGKIKSSLQDELVVPRQELRISGRVHVSRTQGGYLVVPRDLPASVTVEIRSKLAGQLFVLCRQMALVLVNLQCAELERSLTFLDVPLPAPGTEFLLADAELSDSNRRQLDALLADR